MTVQEMHNLTQREIRAGHGSERILIKDQTCGATVEVTGLEFKAQAGGSENPQLPQGVFLEANWIEPVAQEDV